jgi:transcriptional regulator with XRE-family HTH domain
MNLGEQIKEARLNKKLSQSDLAEKLYISKQSISKYENNKAIPSKEILDEIISILNIDVNDKVDNGNSHIKSKNSKKIINCILLFVIIALIALCATLFIQNRRYQEILKKDTLIYNGIEITYLENDDGNDWMYIKILIYNSNDQPKTLYANLFTIDEQPTTGYFAPNNLTPSGGSSDLVIQPKEEIVYYVRLSNSNSIVNEFNLKYAGLFLAHDNKNSN